MPIAITAATDDVGTALLRRPAEAGETDANGALDGALVGMRHAASGSTPLLRVRVPGVLSRLLGRGPVSERRVS